MENNQNVFGTLRALLDNPQSRDSIIEFVENYKGDIERQRKTDLVVEEVYNSHQYCCHEQYRYRFN